MDRIQKWAPFPWSITFSHPICPFSQLEKFFCWWFLFDDLNFQFDLVKRENNWKPINGY
jgi:hypothetical protein